MRDADWMRGAEEAAAAAELTIDDGGKRKEGRRKGRRGRQHFVALKTTLNASLPHGEGEGGCADYTTVGGGDVWGDGTLKGNIIFVWFNQDSIWK